MTKIRFGTDGWRAIMGEDFTEENVARVIQAFCDFKKEDSNKLIYIGYDRRRNSKEISELVACVLAANGFTVKLADSFCPTPCVSWLVKTNEGLAGIMVTASHNPPQWNGIKFKESYGGAASPRYTGEIETQIEGNLKTDRQPETMSLETALETGKVEYFDPDSSYVTHLRNFIDIKKIVQAGFKIVVDPLFGAGTDFVEKVLGQNVMQIHGEKDPNFGGLNPEPIAKNLEALKEAVLENKANVGLATDGDADRIGAYDENGCFVNSHQIFSLLLCHNVKNRKLSGPIIKSISTTSRIEAICKKYDLKLTVTPIGFKYISQQLLAQDALMGGEESGGISLRDHVHERDGVLNGLLLLEMMAVEGKSLSELILDMEQEFGCFYFQRDDYNLTEDKINFVKEKSKQEPKAVGSIAFKSVERMDGTQYVFEDGSWLLVRASGTEPLLRVYAEAATQERVATLLNFAKDYFELPAVG